MCVLLEGPAENKASHTAGSRIVLILVSGCRLRCFTVTAVLSGSNGCSFLHQIKTTSMCSHSSGLVSSDWKKNDFQNSSSHFRSSGPNFCLASEGHFVDDDDEEHKTAVFMRHQIHIKLFQQQSSLQVSAKIFISSLVWMVRYSRCLLTLIMISNHDNRNFLGYKTLLICELHEAQAHPSVISVLQHMRRFMAVRSVTVVHRA